MRLLVLAPNAEKTTEEIARPQLLVAAQAVAEAMPGNVPVRTGTMRRLYQTSVVEEGDAVRVSVGSPFWHWLEYGTADNPPFRVAERSVRGVGLRYRAQ